MKLIRNVFNENMIEKIASLQRVSRGFYYKILEVFFNFCSEKQKVFVYKRLSGEGFEKIKKILYRKVQIMGVRWR